MVKTFRLRAKDRATVVECKGVYYNGLNSGEVISFMMTEGGLSLDAAHVDQCLMNVGHWVVSFPSGVVTISNEALLYDWEEVATKGESEATVEDYTVKVDSCSVFRRLKASSYIPYQKCPVCDGFGQIQPNWNRGTTSAVWMPCDVCGGKKMIPMYVFDK